MKNIDERKKITPDETNRVERLLGAAAQWEPALPTPEGLAHRALQQRRPALPALRSKIIWGGGSAGLALACGVAFALYALPKPLPVAVVSPKSHTTRVSVVPSRQAKISLPAASPIRLSAQIAVPQRRRLLAVVAVARPEQRPHRRHEHQEPKATFSAKAIVPSGPVPADAISLDGDALIVAPVVIAETASDGTLTSLTPAAVAFSPSPTYSESEQEPFTL